jgi:hypothetical protein
MNPGPDFWAAVRLAAFANMPLVEFEDFRAYRPRHWLRRLPEFWREYLADVLRHGLNPPGRQLPRDAVAVGKQLNIRRSAQAFDLWWAGCRPWVDVYVDDPWQLLPTVDAHRGFRRIQNRVRSRLAAICSDQNLAPLYRELRRVPARRERLGLHATSRVLGQLHDHFPEPNAPTSAEPKKMPQRWHALQPKRVERWYAFGLEAAPVDLGQHIDDLFIRTALAGLWPHFYRCATCERFNVTRLRPSAARPRTGLYCVGTSTCRTIGHRRGLRTLH